MKTLAIFIVTLSLMADTEKIRNLTDKMTKGTEGRIQQRWDSDSLVKKLDSNHTYNQREENTLFLKSFIRQ